MPPSYKSASSTSSHLAHIRSSIHTIRPGDIAEILCHRRVHGNEEYLVRWRTEPLFPRPLRAPLSWHPLPELNEALHHVQTYIQTLPPRAKYLTTQALTSLATKSRKRKAPDVEPEPSRDLERNGLLTPLLPTPDRSISPPDGDEGTALDDIQVCDETSIPADEPRTYNAVLQKKGGHITAKRIPKHETTSTGNLPSPLMLRRAARTSITQAEHAIRIKFMEMLKPVKGVFLENRVDRSTPSLNFTFIKDYVLREGVDPLSSDSLEGCDKCKPDMGGHCGCEYTAICGCLEYAGVDEKGLRSKDFDLYTAYKTAVELSLESGEEVDTRGLPKRFPYSKPKAKFPQTLVKYYLEQRHPIYECNDNCNCGPICKSRLVQKGRKVELTIFKTEHRGWGVYCNEDLVQGEFIDTYLGEVITSQEADRRERKSGYEKCSYLYTLDKFVGDVDPTNPSLRLQTEDCHVVDGQYMGTPTRFINHSCEPNCRQYTVSYNKYDLRVYQLAFFAYQDIPKGTELTFDYQDEDELEEEDAIAKRREAEQDPENAKKPRCGCGARKCRGFLWTQGHGIEGEDDEEDDDEEV